ncbi:tropomodulin-1-like [Biomphalaria glabrata]|uniref:Tropomodulin-1-like n=2 Tax=Biomphalaria glabrata TaxID=6526 RepID=A0A9W2YT27_BIOGL|nr:tropomodulin-1-like [Biomphalaria glabrata]XP_055865958.1 tropomodulin-1-like [Biomphalaria glabrata]XP_055865960.1 tropomodulin-1-like [Biomphalaria glabrata]
MSVLNKAASVDVPDISLENLDDLLNALTAEEIEELNGDFDPDNSLLPPSQRCRDQTSKVATGPFNRQKLLHFLEEKAKQEKDWENSVPFTKETKGKKFVPKEQEKTTINEDDVAVETEWDEILTAASEEELVDLAAVLGFHSMLTQTQYYASLEDRPLHEGGFSGYAQAQKLKIIPDEAPNMTDVEESIKQLKDNNKELKSLNLNNIKNISIERLIEVCEALKDNTVCVRFDMASVGATDRVAKALSESLRVNSTLKTVNVESNFISGEGIVELLKAANVTQSLLELRVANQKPEVLGNKVEMEIAKLVKENSKLLRLGIHFEFPVARIKVNDKLKENLDALRKKRVGKESS